MDARVLDIGEVVTINGQRMRYIGDGRFEPEGQWPTMAKRFDAEDGQPLHRPLPQGGPLCS